MKWRPISSAPKGPDVLLYARETGNPGGKYRIVVGYTEGCGCSINGERNEGWWQSDSDDEGGIVYLTPALWAPLDEMEAA